MNPVIASPETAGGNVVDTLFGQNIPDPYRWLENDARSNDDVANWVAAQNKHTQAHPEELPQREVFGWRPKVLYVRDGDDGVGRVLVNTTLNKPTQLHAFGYVAALQAADMWAVAAHWTGFGSESKCCQVGKAL